MMKSRMDGTGFLIDQADPAKHLAEHGLVDYDDWVDISFLTRAGAPIEVFDFLQALPEYEPIIEDHRKDVA
jgi:hypothetical protein